MTVMEAHIPFLREVLVFLGASALLIPAFGRIRLDPVLGYLIIGALIGPYGIGAFAEGYPLLSAFTIDNPAIVHGLAEFGIVFLLFSIGLEFSVERLWSMRRLMFGLGTLQIIITAVAITGVALLWGNSPAVSLIIGASLALSSTAVVMKLLTDRQQFTGLPGQTGFMILLMQDLAVVPLILMVSFLAQTGEGAALGETLLFSLGKAGLVIVAIFIAGKYALQPLFGFVSKTKSSELFIALVLLVVLGASYVTHAAGLTLSLGAFLAGLSLTETEFRHQIEADIEPFKGLLMGLFFMSVGMGLNFAAVQDTFFWLLLSVAGLFTIKAVIITVLCKIFRLPLYAAVTAGLMLGQAGEFAFITLGLAEQLSLLEAGVAQFMMIVAGFSILVTPLMHGLAYKAGAYLRDKDKTDAPSPDQITREFGGHVLLAGYGRVGSTLGEMLDKAKIPYIAVDSDSAVARDAYRKGHPVFFGDAQRKQVLDLIGIERARAAVVTVHDKKACLKIVQSIHKCLPAVPIIARAHNAAHAKQLTQAGATAVYPEVTEASLQMGGRLLDCLNMPPDAVYKIIEDFRSEDEAVNQSAA
tara:strand:+ start:61 stop:1809 length:1749 start_codon:yes stop_codon:yes gene_type:complete